MEISCPLIEKPQSSDRFVKSQNPHGQSQRTTPATIAIAAAAASSLSCVDGSLFASPFSRMVFRQKQSCVRPVSATHMAAGPDGFHQPSPIPHIEQQAFWTKLGVSWFLG
jgi:hypothetical protein